MTTGKRGIVRVRSPLRLIGGQRGKMLGSGARAAQTLSLLLERVVLLKTQLHKDITVSCKVSTPL